MKKKLSFWIRRSLKFGYLEKNILFVKFKGSQEYYLKLIKV